MKSILLCLIFTLSIFTAQAQKPYKNGTYTYAIAWAEWGDKQIGTCTVIIKGDSVKVLDNGKSYIGEKKGFIIEQGILIKHRKTGKWIIGKSPKDKDASEVGGCGGAPFIDFKRKIFELC